MACPHVFVETDRLNELDDQLGDAEEIAAQVWQYKMPPDVRDALREIRKALRQARKIVDDWQAVATGDRPEG